MYIYVRLSKPLSIAHTNLLLPLVYPETRNRSLESIDALFSTSSPFFWKMEQAYKEHGDVLAEHGVDKDEAIREVETSASAKVTNV